MGVWAKHYLEFAAEGGKVGWMQGYESAEELAKQLENEMKLHQEGFRGPKGFCSGMSGVPIQPLFSAT